MPIPQRYVDTKNFEGLGEVLTEDAVDAYDSGKYLVTGLKTIIEFLAAALMRDDIATLHQVHCPELALTSPTSATGIWYLHDYVINPGEGQGTLSPADRSCRARASTPISTSSRTSNG